MPKSPSNIEVICTCCHATLVVDPKTGLVLRSRGKKPDHSFEEALAEVKQRKEKSDELFEKAFFDEKKRQHKCVIRSYQKIFCRIASVE